MGDAMVKGGHYFCQALTHEEELNLPHKMYTYRKTTYSQPDDFNILIPTGCCRSEKIDRSENCGHETSFFDQEYTTDLIYRHFRLHMCIIFPSKVMRNTTMSRYIVAFFIQY